MISLAFSGCAQQGANSLLPAPSTERLKLAADVTGECKQLSAQVREPVMRPGDDAVIVIAAYRAALETANDRLGGTGKCVADLSARYANYAAGVK